LLIVHTESLCVFYEVYTHAMFSIVIKEIFIVLRLLYLYMIVFL
jgi:hypothetical protein